MRWESSRNRCSVFRVSIKASDNLKSPADIKRRRAMKQENRLHEKEEVPYGVCDLFTISK